MEYQIFDPKDRFKIIGNYIFIFLIGALQIIYPIYVARIIQNIGAKETVSYQLIFVLGVLIFGKLFFSIIQSIYSSRIYWSQITKLKRRLMKRVLDINYVKAQKIHIGEATQTIDNDTEQYINFYVIFLGILLKDLMTIVGITLVAFYVKPIISFFILSFVGIMFWFFRQINKRAEKSWQKYKIESENFFSTFSEIIDVIFDFKGIHQVSFLQNYFNKALKKLFKVEFIANLVSYRLWLSSLMSLGLLKVIILATGIYLALQGKVVIGTIYLFIYYIDMLNDPLEEFRIQIENLPSVKESSCRIKRMLSLKDERAYGEYLLNKKIKRIEFKQVDFQYDEKVIFKKFNRTLEKSTSYCLCGSSGAGKSTLIHLLTRLFDVKAGNIFINQHPIESFKKGELQKEIFYLGQNQVLSNLDITFEQFFDISDKDKIRELLKKFLPQIQSLDQKIEELNLSTGHQKVLFLIKAILRDQSVILIDELFAGVDPHKVQEIIELMKNQEKLILIITHEQRIMNLCDEQINLQELKNGTSID